MRLKLAVNLMSGANKAQSRRIKTGATPQG